MPLAERIAWDAIRMHSPELSDRVFLEDHPGVENVASFLHEAHQTTISFGRSYLPFRSVGAESVVEYLQALAREDPLARRVYESTKSVLGF